MLERKGCPELPMADFHSSTLYADVNRVLHEFLDRIQSILSAQFVGFYLYGSLALGDFDPGTSDIDFLVVTRDDITDDQLVALQEMHARFEQSGSAWTGKIEAAYVPLEALNHPAPASARYPQLERGTTLVRAPLEPGWAFQRYTLREQAVIVTGPPLRGLSDPVEPLEMQQAAAAILGGWQRQARTDPSWVAWARQRSSQAFIVLTVCRIRYSLETGTVASKPAAARWAKAALGGRWRSLINRALSSQKDEKEGSESELVETLIFLQDALHHLQ